MRRVAVTVGVSTCTGSLPVLVLLLPVLSCGIWSVITMFSSRDVPCRIGRAAGAGGVMDVRKRKKEREGDNIDERPQGHVDEGDKDVE